MKKLLIALLAYSVMSMSAADLYDVDAQKKEELSNEGKALEELFRKHRKPGIPADQAYPTGYFDHYTQGPDILPETLLFEERMVEMPGEQCFYSSLYLGEDQGKGGSQGILAGTAENTVRAVVQEYALAPHETIELIGSIGNGVLRFKKSRSPGTVRERLALAVRAALDKAKIDAFDDPTVSLSTVQLNHLCDILIPLDLQEIIPKQEPCKHTTSDICKEYSARVLAHIAALAQTAPVKHQGLVMVPYVRPACFSCIE